MLCGEKHLVTDGEGVTGHTQPLCAPALHARVTTTRTHEHTTLSHCQRVCWYFLSISPVYPCMSGALVYSFVYFLVYSTSAFRSGISTTASQQLACQSSS